MNQKDFVFWKSERWVQDPWTPPLPPLPPLSLPHMLTSACMRARGGERAHPSISLFHSHNKHLSLVGISRLFSPKRGICFCSSCHSPIWLDGWWVVTHNTCHTHTKTHTSLRTLCSCANWFFLLTTFQVTWPSVVAQSWLWFWTPPGCTHSYCHGRLPEWPAV